jgi:hypothetical protein
MCIKINKIGKQEVGIWWVQKSDFCHQQLLRKMRRKISWTDGRTDRGKTVYPPPPSGSRGIIREICLINNLKTLLFINRLEIDLISNKSIFWLKLLNFVNKYAKKYLPLKFDRSPSQFIFKDHIYVMSKRNWNLDGEQKGQMLVIMAV